MARVAELNATNFGVAGESQSYKGTMRRDEAQQPAKAAR
jgi:hypothetical protein